MNRRELLGTAAGFVAGVTLPPAQAHCVKMIDKGAAALVLIELPESYEDVDDDRLARIHDHLQKQFGDVKFVLLPSGCKTTVVPNGDVAYQKESLDTYSYEIWAKDEATLRERYKLYIDPANCIRNY